jgi:CBS domain-containing protein
MLEDTGNLLLGDDIKNPFNFSISADSTLFEAKDYMDKLHLGFIPVVDDRGSILGCFDRRMYQNFISAKFLELHQGDD